jgi:hypothetical protein
VRVIDAPRRPSVVTVIYRKDLIDHFEWLAGSEYFDDVIDEALVAIAITAHGHGSEMVQSGGAWWFANDFCRYHRLEKFIEKAHSERSRFGAAGPSDLSDRVEEWSD